MEFEFNWESNLMTGLNSIIGNQIVHTDLQILKNILNLVKNIYLEFKNFGKEL